MFHLSKPDSWILKTI